MTDRSGPGGSRQARVRWLGLLPLLLALSACAGDDATTQQDLSLACEMHKCDCAPDSEPFKAGVPVLWQTDGSTYSRRPITCACSTSRRVPRW